MLKALSIARRCDGAYLAPWTSAAMRAVRGQERSGSTFASAEQHAAWLETQAALPRGFRVGTHAFQFRPRELPQKLASMTLTIIALDAPTTSFAAMFTRNAFPGAPVIVGRKRLNADTLQAVVVNNKISNVCAPAGVDDSERVCAAVAAQLGLASPDAVLPSSTGVIG